MLTLVCHRNICENKKLKKSNTHYYHFINFLDILGKSDPYLVVKLGGDKQTTKEKYIPNTLDPFFGQLFQFKVLLECLIELLYLVPRPTRSGRELSNKIQQ